ncbi:MlaD family protein [Hydrogenophaga sp. RWCD_12]|uniref:MlaD family protein n=1 Tax=Hydrogenophaga sp. RWCD_12 TaxID=3391190 RepID=UPI003985312D
MNSPETPPPLEPSPPPVKNLELKAALLLLFLLLLVVGSALYVAYARGAFERTQRLVLVAPDSEGVAVGMNVTFAGFPIGKVGRIELADDGNVHFLVDVPVKDAKWLRSSSIFTMEKSLVGGTRIRAFSGVLTDPALEDGAVRQVLSGDAAAEIPGIVASVKELVGNLNALTAADAPLPQSLVHLQGTAARLNGPQGAMGALFGNDADAKKVIEAVERANALLAKVDKLTARLDGLVANADRQVFGQGAGPGGSTEGGLVQDARGTVKQLDGLLGEARGSLQKVDKLLIDAQGIAANTREATTDLGQLRAEVDASLRKVESLINEVNRLWPLKRDADIQLK